MWSRHRPRCARLGDAAWRPSTAWTRPNFLLLKHWPKTHAQTCTYINIPAEPFTYFFRVENQITFFLRNHWKTRVFLKETCDLCFFHISYIIVVLWCFYLHICICIKMFQDIITYTFANRFVSIHFYRGLFKYVISQKVINRNMQKYHISKNSYDNISYAWYPHICTRSQQLAAVAPISTK